MAFDAAVDSEAPNESASFPSDGMKGFSELISTACWVIAGLEHHDGNTYSLCDSVNESESGGKCESGEWRRVSDDENRMTEPLIKRKCSANKIRVRRVLQSHQYL